MLAPSRVIKQTALTAIRGNWLKSIVVSSAVIFALFVCILVSDLIATITSQVFGIMLLVLLCFLLISPLFLSALNFWRRLLWGEDDNPVLIFSCFADIYEYRRSLEITAMIAVRLLANGALLLSPCLIVRIFASSRLYSIINVPMPVWAGSLIYVASFLGVLGGLALFFLMLKLYIAPFLFVADCNMDADEAINMSTIISKRTSSDFFWLIISFSGYIIAGIFVIPLIFILPYFVCAYLVHCRFAVAQYNRDADRFNTDNSTTYKVG